jgi:hypothetical protein
VVLNRTLVVMDALLTTVFPGTKSKRFNPGKPLTQKGGVDHKAADNAMAYDVVRAKFHKAHKAVFRDVFVNHLNQERQVSSPTDEGNSD